jgi:hypothetical protein
LYAGYISWIALHGNASELIVQPIDQLPGGEPGSPVGEEIKVFMNGTRYFMNPNPYLKNDRTMVPMRRIFEMLGAQVTWNEEEQSVTAGKGSDTIKLYIGSTIAYKNGLPVTLDAVPEIIAEAGRTMIPLRFVSEALNCGVEWDAASQSVMISNGI